MFFLSCVCHIFVRVCLYLLCGHLLGKGWPLGSLLWCLTVSLSLSHWYPGSGTYLIVSIPDLCTLTYFKSLLHQRLWEPEFYGDLVSKFEKNVGSNNF